MSDNIINFSAFKKKSKDSESKESFDLTLAKQIVKNDPQIQNVIQHLGVTIDEAANWVVLISNFQSDMEKVIYDYSQKTSFSVPFCSLLIQAMSLEISDQLTSIGMQPSVTKEIFQKFQKNSISTILQASHLEDLMVEDFNNYEGEDK